MRIINIFLGSVGLLLIASCSSVKLPVTNAYQLTGYSDKQFVSCPRNISLLVTAPDAVAGYQTDAMLYINKPFELEAFAKNEWTAPPAEMLYPLLIKSLQRSGFFYGVSSSLYTQKTDYRLDTQLLNLEQSFLRKPSVLEFTVKIVLTHNEDNKVVASRIVGLQIPCPSDTPYGGVVAANQASRQLTEIVTHFVISHIKHG